MADPAPDDRRRDTVQGMESPPIRFKTIRKVKALHLGLSQKQLVNSSRM